MSKLTVACIFGTRPDAVKMAPLVKELLRYPEQIRTVAISTGQHREMLDQVLSVFALQPDYDLGLMKPGQSLSELTSRALMALEPVLEKEKPKLVIAQGDTTTTFAASLAAFYAQADFGHVEAGLRTDNKFDPFPEEMNRRLTTRLTNFHYAPTELSKENLLREGIAEETIRVTGNTVVDALRTVSQLNYQFDDPTLAEFVARPGRLILVTAHRRENWGERMASACRAIRRIVETYPDVRVVFPMHRNPLVREVVLPLLKDHDRILLTEPLDYFPFVHVMKASHFLLTDSGGAQEEAPGLGKPVLILRLTTERPEGVHSGNAKLVGTDETVVFEAANTLLGDEAAYAAMARAASPYGDGDAARRIREWIFEAYQL
ncbi:non-hydrolyzing UDP-N-acetylglucosamine 2-epimerase [Armatimonas rosea]|uniref:UDP-N-acetylglucosamine 2-epimerase (non-hydrolyzing) n=1 Tax=Armatimonas rosea TaxID=685828 RepID=A0A7W9SRK4_ARMRO|nr:UDP-N-acetylglucosamine 2-epimerase (non-hydrolyzing) [Armatimonas rosea]MBB6051530.1 UDP-N-acetylglucosamine 2-epimerase (non-hydrolyzing) [Armatimonas rosea]